MNRPIKFRQKFKPKWDVLNEEYHYWGYIDDGFTSPMGQLMAVGGSEQFTGELDANGDEIYE
jgi:hypothetical protein